MRMHNAIPDFPVSVPDMITWAVLLVFAGLAFIQLLLHLNRKGYRWAITLIFGLLLIAGTAIHVVLLSRSSHTVTEGNWIQLIMVSMVAALEMFIGHTVVFDDIIAAVIFREPLLMIAYISIFVLVLLFTLSMVVLIMPRRLRDRIWLRMNSFKASRDRKNHVFLGVSPYAILMAGSILKEWSTGDRKNQGEIIFIDFPSAQDHHAELSLGELVANIFGNKKQRSLDQILGSDRFAMLRAHLPSSDNGTLCHAIGLDKLEPWLKNPRTTLYILNESDQDNFTLLKALSRDGGVQAKSFLYAHEPDNFYSLFAHMGRRIRVLDSHYMSFMQLKLNRPEVLPVHFVDIARDKDGEPLGYVHKGLQAMIIGFGECGQEALRYLYEFGNFAGKDLEAAPMSISIYEKDMTLRRGHFLHTAPGLQEDTSIRWHAEQAGSDSFWQEYDRLLDNGLRYIVVAMDKGSKNIALAVYLLQRAAQKKVDLSRFIILTRIWNCDTQTDDLLRYYNQSFCPEGVSVIQPFGRMETIWSPDVISGRSLKQTAIRFSKAYQKACGVMESWDERRSRLSKDGGNVLAKHRELLRRQALEIGRALFVPTLLELASKDLYKAAQDIPPVYENTHYPHKDEARIRLEYLAATEHMHWMAQLLLSGYTHGPLDELLKSYPNIIPYTAIQDDNMRHMSWVGVRTALLLDKEQ